MPVSSYIMPIAGALLAVLLLARPQAAALGALNALLCWAKTVAPAMLPFLALLPLLTGPAAAALLERTSGKAMGRLFGLPGAAAGAVAAGMLGGSPTGALAAMRAPGLRGEQRAGLAMAVGGLSPAFLVGGVGGGMLGSPAMGRVLLAAQLCTQLTLLRLLRTGDAGSKEPPPPSDGGAAAPPMTGAVLAVCTVGGWMALFGALGQALRPTLPGVPGRALLALADVVTGTAWIAGLNCDIFLKMVLLAALCGFGGGCIGLQNLAILRESGVRPARWFAVRLLAGGISTLYTAAILALGGVSVPAGQGRMLAIALPCMLGALVFLPGTQSINIGNRA